MCDKTNTADCIIVRDQEVRRDTKSHRASHTNTLTLYNIPFLLHIPRLGSRAFRVYSPRNGAIHPRAHYHCFRSARSLRMRRQKYLRSREQTHAWPMSNVDGQHLSASPRSPLLAEYINFPHCFAVSAQDHGRTPHPCLTHALPHACSYDAYCNDELQQP